jgi:hypothetical protein
MRFAAVAVAVAVVVIMPLPSLLASRGTMIPVVLSTHHLSPFQSD